MSTTGIERPIELAPDKHRELLGKRYGVLLLPMNPQPTVNIGVRGLLQRALRDLGQGYAWGDTDAELLDAAYREGMLGDLRCPWGRGGDGLWCREPWAQVGRGFRYRNRDAVKGDDLVWMPAARMPRQAARLALKIDDVGIADADARFVWRLEVEVLR